ncbi:RICIN domain-containing protein [Paenibacillus larvae]|uniref:RICIN domain-containing protein n=1 Tax=Paenibacillus larvae TaxID=1464 RepID=UPI001F3F6EF8|nr:RICIN domain-containing protein [Paenibacillus larvae]
MKLETTQFQGAFARRSPAGGQVVLEENEWAHYMPQIESVTAGILINMGGDRFIERRIAAKDPLNPNDRTPELTLGEALEKSIGMFLDEENQNRYFIDEETGTKHIISPDLVHLVYDTKTDKKIKEELNKTIGEYQIVSSIGENKVADLADNRVVIYGNHEGNNQKWRFTFNRDKQAYKITSVSNPKLALTWDSKDSDKIFGYAGDYDSQYWRVERTSDGYFTLRNYKNPKMVLDLPDSNTTNSNQLKAYKDNGGSGNQKWHLQNVQKNPDGKTIYDMTIRPGMNIQINVPVLYDDFTEKSGQWDGGDYDKENALYKGQCYKIPKKEVGVYSDFSLERNAVYLIVMAIKGSEAGNFTVEINGVTGTKEIGNFIVDKDYKYEKMVLKTFGDMEQHLELLIKNHTQSPVYIDNFSIVKIGRGFDELKKENIKYAENLKSDEIFYISPISDETTVITNLNNKAYMRKKSTNEKQFFRFDFNNIDNSFTIIDGSATTGGFEYVLKWNGDSEITFDVVATLKLDSWYLKKSTNPDQMGYQIINVWDRSKVLEYVDGEEKDGWPIEIATLDENNPSQYFQFPQKIKDLILWVSRKDENINVTNMNPIVVPKDFKNKDEEREIDLLFYSEGRVDMNQYEIKIGNPDLLRVTTDSEWKKKGHLNFKITNNLTGHADIKIVDAQAKSTFKTFTIQVE